MVRLQQVGLMVQVLLLMHGVMEQLLLQHLLFRLGHIR